MVKHIVMWNVQKEFNKEEVLGQLKYKLEGLVGRIDVLKKLEVGFDYPGTDASRDVVLYSEFDSKEDLKAYVVHPAHVEVGPYVRSVTCDRVVVDYEI